MICFAKPIAEQKTEKEEHEKFYKVEARLTSIAKTGIPLKRKGKDFFRKCLIWWLKIIRKQCQKTDGYCGSFCLQIPELNIIWRFRFAFVFIPDNRRLIILSNNKKILTIQGGNYTKGKVFDNIMRLLIFLVEVMVAKYVIFSAKEPIEEVKISMDVNETELDLIKTARF